MTRDTLFATNVFQQAGFVMATEFGVVGGILTTNVLLPARREESFFALQDPSPCL